jgi:hypothetical protein
MRGVQEGEEGETFYVAIRDPLWVSLLAHTGQYTE